MDHAEAPRINLRNISELASQPHVKDSVEALLKASDGDPVTAIAAMAEAVWKENGGKFAGADAVLYRTLQAQLSGKYRSVLEGPHASPNRGGVVAKKGPKQPQHTQQPQRPPKSTAGDDHGPTSPSPYGGTGSRLHRRPAGHASPSKAHNRTAPASGGEAAESTPGKPPRGKPARPAAGGQAADEAEEQKSGGEEERAGAGEASARTEGSLQPHRAGGKAFSSMSTRKSLRGLRSISAPVPPRPPKARSVPGGDKSGTMVSANTTKKTNRPGASVDIHSWLMDRRRKEREREEMRQARLKNDARFIEKLDERQAERNKLLQEAEERMAQNVAGKKGQKWKPVPFTPWPEANKAQAEVVTEDTIFKKDVERLFGMRLDADKQAGAQGAAGGAGGARIPTPKQTPSGRIA